MKELLIYMLETLTASGVLLAAYVILLERRVAFRWCRAWLLASVVLAALIPLLRIPVWAARVVTVQPMTFAAAEVAGEIAEESAAPAFAVAPEQVVWGVYGAGVLFMLGLLLWQCLSIRRLEQGAEVEDRGDYRLVRTARPVASFSFFRTVYLFREVSEADLPAILAHEQSHVRHRHSFERVAMELLRAALWWNPFVWFASRRLVEAQEFEADADVIRQGYEMANYIQTIFKQLFGYSPEIANGLRDSLTKKRFKMMTTKRTSRHARLRLAATLPLVAALVVAFGFTAKATVYRTLPPSGSETEDAARPIGDDDPYLIVDQMPTFKGGDVRNFRQWLMMQIRYPAEAQSANKQGRVVVQFVVEKDGTLNDFKVLESPDPLLSEEVLRVLKLSPKWTPGLKNDEPVRVKYTLPVDFRLDKADDKPVAAVGMRIPESGDANTVDEVKVIGFGTQPEQE